MGSFIFTYWSFSRSPTNNYAPQTQHVLSRCKPAFFSFCSFCFFNSSLNEWFIVIPDQGVGWYSGDQRPLQGDRGNVLSWENQEDYPGWQVPQDQQIPRLRCGLSSAALVRTVFLAYLNFIPLSRDNHDSFEPNDQLPFYIGKFPAWTWQCLL